VVYAPARHPGTEGVRHPCGIVLRSLRESFYQHSAQPQAGSRPGCRIVGATISTYRKNKNPFQKMAGLHVTLAGGSVISEWPSDQLMGNYVCSEENSDLAQVYGGR
jgi:hypothetical protein